MKKIFLLKLVILITLISCKDNSYRKKEYIITNFKEVIRDTITPIKGDSYGAKSISVSGFVDDSIYVKFNGSYKFYLKGKVDTIISADYYGESKVGFEFNPYKAKKGELKVTFGI
jgi:hypothetical protein